MKKLILLSIAINLIAVYSLTAQSGVSINNDGSSADGSAMLDVKSTTKGFLPPRMTQNERNAIATPVAGLIVWCTDCGSGGELQAYNGSTWTNMVGEQASGPPTGQVYLYGTTSEEGANGLGTIYRVDENGQNFQKLFDFTTATGGKPFAGLTLANEKLYGFTTEGGQIVNSGATLALGTFYEFDPSDNTLNVIEYIDDQSSIGNGFFHSPTLSADGLLYLISQNLGLSELDGVLSSFDPNSSSITVLATLTGFYGQPKSKLLEASDGDLYITTNNSAEFGFGGLANQCRI